MTLAIWASTVAAASGMSVLLEGVGWLVQAAVVAFVIVAAPAAARSLRAPGWVPPVLSFVVMVGVLTLAFAPANALLGVVPTSATITDVEALVAAGGESIAQQGLPAQADAGISFLIVLGVAVFAWAFDTVAFTVRTPAIGGALLAALLAVPSIIDPSQIAWVALIATTVGYLVVLALDAALRDRPRARPRQGGVRPRAAADAGGGRPARASVDRQVPARRGARGLRDAVAVAAAAVIVGAVVASIVPGFVRTASGTGSGSGTIFSGGIDPIIALGNDLRRPDPVTVLTYSSTTGSSEYLRVLTLDTFEGAEWQPTDPGTETTGDVAAFPAPAGLSPDVPTTPNTTAVDITTLRSRWLPLAYPTQSIDGVSSAWGVDPSDLSVSGEGTTRRGQSYRATSLVVEPEEDFLRQVPQASNEFDVYRALPDDVPELVVTTAQEVTAESTTDYDRAVAIQRYLRGSAFTYSEDAPVENGYDGDGVGVLEDFLTQKSGYCVHFSSAMAVMARELGIPARIAVGYQPGTLVPSRSSETPTYRVQSSDLHAWPELYFEGAGWLAFEPTPGRGSPADYTFPSTPGAVTPQQTDAATPDAPGETTEAATPTPSAVPSADATPIPTATVAGSPTAVVWWTSLIAVLLAIPALLRLLQAAARRRAGASGDVEAAWAEVIATLHDLGAPPPKAATPREVEREVLRALRADSSPPAAAGARVGAGADGGVGAGADISADVLGALERLRTAVERGRYAAPTPTALPGATSAAAGASGGAEADAWSVADALRARASVATRVVARVFPRSVLRVSEVRSKIAG